MYKMLSNNFYQVFFLFGSQINLQISHRSLKYNNFVTKPEITCHLYSMLKLNILKTFIFPLSCHSLESIRTIFSSRQSAPAITIIDPMLPHVVQYLKAIL